MPLTANSLKDISAVYVFWEDLSNGSNMLGLTQENIQTDVELKLRLAGIRVVTEAEAANLLSSPCLYVSTFVSPTGDLALAEIKVMQQVWLDRNAQSTYAATWQRNKVSLNVHPQFVRDQIKGLVDQFLNAWLSVNPKK